MENNNESFYKAIDLLRSYWDVQKNIMQLVQRMAVRNDLTVPQLSILRTVGPQKEMTQKNIGETTYIPKSTLSQAVDGLVQAGLLVRQQVEGNRREVLLSVSEKGEALLKSIHQQDGNVLQVFQAIVEDLTDKEYQELLIIHQKITSYIETKAMEQEE